MFDGIKIPTAENAVTDEEHQHEVTLNALLK
jgi:hypothetical protein